jgi:pimeloyl-ACP methyl ester carboxylesterase
VTTVNSQLNSYATIGGVRLHYLEWPGTGPPVLCLPGITANAHAFARLAEALSPARRILAVDLRGRGQSDKPAEGYDIGTHVADLAGLLDSLQIDRAAVVGWSLGAKVALALAAVHPARVERLIAIDPPVETSPAAAAALRVFWARLDRKYESTEAFLAATRAAWPYTDWSPYVERYLRWDVEEMPDGIVRHRIPRHVPEAELAAEARYPTRSFYPDVRCPVLIMRAPLPLRREGDQVLTAEDAREMATLLADARLVEIEGANHFSILLSASPQSVEMLAEFLAGDRVPAADGASHTEGVVR